MKNIFGFLLALCLKWTSVFTHPLGLEEKGMGIHQRQPNYLPSYNGIFSIHALNFSMDTSTVGHHAANQTDDKNSPISPPLNNEEVHIFSEDNTNELDFKDRLTVAESTTVPHMQVITQTINDKISEEVEDVETQQTTAPEDDHPTRLQTTHVVEEHETTATDEDVPDSETTSREDTRSSQDVASTEQEPTNREPLVEGSEDRDDESELQPEDEDIFDRLMKTIQDHWLDFVGKMKLSVLDVWKSISSHMMERLETFASGL